jgi:hypothetical protein
MKAKGEEGVNEYLVGVTSDIRMREKLGGICSRILRSTVQRQSRCDCRQKQDGSARTRSPRKDDTRAAQSNLPRVFSPPTLRPVISMGRCGMSRCVISLLQRKEIDLRCIVLCHACVLSGPGARLSENVHRWATMRSRVWRGGSEWGVMEQVSPILVVTSDDPLHLGITTRKSRRAEKKKRAEDAPATSADTATNRVAIHKAPRAVHHRSSRDSLCRSMLDSATCCRRVSFLLLSFSHDPSAFERAMSSFFRISSSTRGEHLSQTSG